MRKLTAILLTLIMLLSLASCNILNIAETITDTLTYAVGDPLEPGYYIVSSVGESGDVTFYSLIEPENGYVIIEEDGTGVMYFEGEEKSLTWDGDYFYFDDVSAPYIFTSAESSEDGQAMLTVYLLESETSIIFRPFDENNQ